MVAVDTNILVRLLTRDDESQYQDARKLFQATSIYIPLTVLLETEWVLRYAYSFSPERVGEALRLLLGLPQVNLDYAHQVAQALDWHSQGMDFADGLHLAASGSADRFATFDKKLIVRTAELSKLPVGPPA